MSTKNLIPRGSGEGGIGIPDTTWGQAHFDSGHFNKELYLSGQSIGAIVSQGGLGGKWDDATTPGDIYYTGGNVGIGTTNPSAKLHVPQGGSTIAGVDLSNASILVGATATGIGIDNNEIIKKQGTNGGELNIASQGVGASIKLNTGADTANNDMPFDRMIIASNGNVGIGIMNPDAKLDVAGKVYFSKIPCNNSTVPASLFTGAAMRFAPASSGFGTGKSKDIALSWESLHDTGGNVGETDFLFGSVNSSGNPQEIMKLYSDGHVRIGRNSSENIAGQQSYGFLLPAGSLEIRAEQDTNAATAQLRIVGGSGLTTGQPVTGSLYIDNGGTSSTVGKFKISQDITGGEIHVVSSINGVKLTSGATSWVSASDETLKENIKPLENVLDKIKDYRCVEYNLKNSPEDKKIGFIAQDWVDDFNPIVNKDEEDVLGMKYTETIPVLLKAIQEQQQLIEDLRSEVEALKNK